MVVYKLVLSNSAPALRNAVDTDSVVTDFSDVIGENTDDKNTMTLYGLKAYIDNAIANLPTNP